MSSSSIHQLYHILSPSLSLTSSRHLKISPSKHLSMSSHSGTDTDRYALVSSFYGPGAVGGWYLTACACLVSLALDPRKRRRDSITVDLIAVLTFPTVAACHLISQVRSAPENATMSQYASILEAPLVAIEAFMAIDVLYFLLAVSSTCLKRGCLFAATGLLCFGAKCNVFFRPSIRRLVEGRFDRMCMMSFETIMFSQMILLTASVLFAFSMIVLFFIISIPLYRDSNNYREAASLQEKQDRSFLGSLHASIIENLSFIILPCTLVAFLFPTFMGIVDLRIAVTDLVTASIPRSDNFIRELDQAVALFTGASVLGFSLFSTAKTYYRDSSSPISDVPLHKNIDSRTEHRVWPSTSTRVG